MSLNIKIHIFGILKMKLPKWIRWSKAKGKYVILGSRGV